jgi:hypothetical protein
MGPGQVEPNEFEIAILDRIACQDACVSESVAQLHVLSRQFTGVGSFTTFRVPEIASGTSKRHISLDAVILMPGVPNGMGAVLFCDGDHPECLETFTYGDDHWEGVYDGFSFERAD